MRCPKCTERNSVAARKCEFCGEKFKRKQLPLQLKLTFGGVALALTAGLVASYVVPKVVNPEQNLARVAKRVAAGPSSPEEATRIKAEFQSAVRNYLKTDGDQKSAQLTAGLQKLLSSSAYEVHVGELPRGLRVVEVDTMLQATDFLVMKTNSGMKVFDLPRFEVFDDGRVIDDHGVPVLTLIGHSGGPPPHRPEIATLALLPDSLADRSDKVPPLTGEGQARFADNGQDILLKLAQGDATAAPAYGLLKWQDAHYVSDFSKKTARLVRRRFQEQTMVACAPVAASQAQAAQAVATARQSVQIKADDAVSRVVEAAAPGLANAVKRANASGKGAKIVVRGLTDHPLDTGADLLAKMPPPASGNGSALAAVPALPPAAPARASEPKLPVSQPAAVGGGLQATAGGKDSAHQEHRHKHQHHDSGGASSSHPAPAYATVSCSGATVRRDARRGAEAIDGLTHGQQVEILSRDNDWVKVRYSGGREGYVFAALLSQSSSKSAQPAATAQAVATAPGASSSRRHHRRHQASVLVAEHGAPAVVHANAAPKHHKHKPVVEEAPNLVP